MKRLQDRAAAYTNERHTCRDGDRDACRRLFRPGGTRVRAPIERSSHP
jgi:hypothetical protein